MIRPDFLKAGDTILFVSPAGKVVQKDVFPTVTLLESWGLKIAIAPNAFAEHYRFAGKDEERLADMQLALDDSRIKAIFCTRGGYGSIRIINKLNFSGFMKHPKWLIGFSDITIFHMHLNSILKCQSLHAPMPINLSSSNVSKTTVENFRKALFGEELYYETPSHPLNIYGESKAEIIGGNLATLTRLLGTGMSYTTKGKILFIEDVSEPIHKIDQMIWALKFAGKLANLKGLIIGSFTAIEDDPKFGKTVQQLIYEAVIPYGFPVIFDFPVGHTKDNYALYIGSKVKLKVTPSKGELLFV